MGTVPSPLLEADYRDFSGSRSRSFGDPRGTSDPRVKLLCSFGGRILPRPSDGRLRYVGGDTRMISVSRYIQFHALQSKMAEIYGPHLIMKYQLPEEDLDALVTVSSDEDLENMMDECDRLDSTEGTSRLRVFVFSSPDGDAIDLNEVGDPRTSEQQYVDAINTLQMDAPFRRNEGMLSSYSPRNADRLIFGASMTDRQAHVLPSRNPTNWRDFSTLNETMGVPLPRHLSDSPQFASDFRPLIPVGGTIGTDFRERLSGGSASSSTSSQYDHHHPHHQTAVHRWNVPPDMPSSGDSSLQGMKKDISNQIDIGHIPNLLKVLPLDSKDHVLNMDTLLSNDLLTEVDGARKPKVDVHENSLQDPGAILQRQLEADRNQNSDDYNEGLQSLTNNGTKDHPSGVQDSIDDIFVPNESSKHFQTMSNSSNAQPNLLDHFIPDVPPLIPMTDSAHSIEQAEFSEKLHASTQQIYIRGEAGYHSVVFPQDKNTWTIPDLSASSVQGPFNPSAPVLLQYRDQESVDHGISQSYMFQTENSNENNHPTSNLASLSFPNPNQGLEEDFPDLEIISEQPISTSMKNYNASVIPSSSSLDDSAFIPGVFSRKDVTPVDLPWNRSAEILPTLDLSSTGLHKDDPMLVKGQEVLNSLSKVSIKVSEEIQSSAHPDETHEGTDACKGEDEVNGSGAGEEPLPPPPFHAPASLIDVWNIAKSNEHDDEASLMEEMENFQSAIDRTVKSEVEGSVNIAAAAKTEAIALGLQKIRHCDLEELRELGSGTFGTVFHGKWKGTDVAIKRIKSICFTGRPSERDRLLADFWQEASILGQLHHPNVVAFYGIVPDGPDGTLATVTEFMVNGSLKQALQKKDRILDSRKRLLIAMDAAFGMEYLHGKNIVHFDLKCENLLVNLRDVQRPICKVGDLGLSKIKQQTMISGGVRGTLPWMAPELLNGRSILVSEKVDVFSFGVVLWELLTGEEPYASMHYGEIIGGIISNSLRPPIPRWCDPKYKALMEACWSADPSARPTFSDIAVSLRNMERELAAKGRAQAGQA